MGEPKPGRAKHHGRDQEVAGSELAVVLKEHQEEIARGWAERIRGLPGSVYGDLSPDEVDCLALRGVEAIAESLETGSHALLDEYLADICPAGSGAIPDTSAVTEALLLCKEAALTVIRNACGPDSDAAWALLSELDACLRHMVGRVTSMCAAETAQQLHDERARVQMLLDMAQTVGSTLELDEVVSRAAEEIVAALGVDGCTFDLVDEERRSAVHLLQPSDWSSRVVAPFDSLVPVFHEVLTTRKPATSYDVLSDPRFRPDTVRELGGKSVLGVPLTVKGKVTAVTWAYTVGDYHRFTAEDIALAQGIGNMLAVVIQNAQLYERSRLLAVMEERARLSREIHDGIAQTLGALQLKASQLEDSLRSQRVGESHGHLSELQEMISRAYRDLREAMLGLRVVVEPGTGLVTALREYVTHYQAQSGLDVRVEVGEDGQATLDGETQAQAVRIVQEALSNVRRHAGTDRVSLSIVREGDRLRICVIDEGQGFDPDLVEGPDHGLHLGLRIMRERAARVGGTLTVESQPGQGTRVVLELPLSGDGGPA